MRKTGIAAWDLALGGLTPGVVRVLGPRALELVLSVVAADSDSADDSLILGLARPPRILSALAQRAQLNGPKLLTTSDPAALISSIRSYSWRYVVLDRLDALRMNSSYVRELDEACVASGTVFFACGVFDASHSGRIDKCVWSQSVQSVRLVPERTGHASGVFELRVIDNPLAPDFVSISPVSVEIAPGGEIELLDVEESLGPLTVEIREVAED